VEDFAEGGFGGSLRFSGRFDTLLEVRVNPREVELVEGFKSAGIRTLETCQKCAIALDLRGIRRGNGSILQFVFRCAIELRRGGGSLGS
jgi:hypothetical protein